MNLRRHLTVIALALTGTAFLVAAGCGPASNGTTANQGNAAGGPTADAEGRSPLPPTRWKRARKSSSTGARAATAYCAKVPRART